MELINRGYIGWEWSDSMLIELFVSSSANTATRDLSRINVIIATAYLGLSEKMAPPNSIGKSPCSVFLFLFLVDCNNLGGEGAANA